MTERTASKDVVVAYLGKIQTLFSEIKIVLPLLVIILLFVQGCSTSRVSCCDENNRQGSQIIISPPSLIEPSDEERLECFEGDQININLRWDPITDSVTIAQYEVELLQSSNRLTFQVENDSFLSINDTCGDLESFYWRVRAIDSLGNAGIWSEERRFIIFVHREGTVGESQ